MTQAAKIRVYGADWCRDCRRTMRQLDDLSIEFDYIDVQADAMAVAEAKEISGRTNIPVVLYPDGSHHVEPTNPDVEEKLRQLSMI
ncbi:glutaredoxin family protein [Streptomyces sp. NPDC102437]|uniref:glutaredoxin family protein n=1 Tax=Streptomyces sp. NPDC102437 TaxID=3366175 RepID=UPI003810E155